VKNRNKNLTEETEWTKPLRLKWDYDINIVDLREMGFKGFEWFNLV
jgi:hypothetical protein